MTDGGAEGGIRLGVVFPQNDIGNDPAQIRDFAQAAEELGYTHLVAFDHVLGVDETKVSRPVVPPVARGPLPSGKWNGPYDRHHAFHEPFVLFGFLAGLTHRIELVTGVLILPQRQTALVAKQAAGIDVLSNGRLRLGVGVGWNPIEYEGLGQDFSTRGQREEEQIRLLRQLWEQETIAFEGRWDTIHHAGINPRPARRIPIWVGGNSPAARQRAARLGDGWFPVDRPDVLATPIKQLRHELVRLGRPIDSFGLEGFVNFAPGDERKWLRQLQAWMPLRPTHLSLNLRDSSLETNGQRIDALERYMKVAGPILREHQ